MNKTKEVKCLIGGRMGNFPLLKENKKTVIIEVIDKGKKFYNGIKRHKEKHLVSILGVK